MGMGDMKLLSVIALLLNTDKNRSLLLFGALLIFLSAVHIYWIAIKTRSISVSIPLAPSIFLALSLYLAT
jgi:Flp pilus assembly protein protease CpaA